MQTYHTPVRKIEDIINKDPHVTEHAKDVIIIAEGRVVIRAEIKCPLYGAYTTLNPNLPSHVYERLRRGDLTEAKARRMTAVPLYVEREGCMALRDNICYIDRSSRNYGPIPNTAACLALQKVGEIMLRSGS